jgi:hypothetical protein
MKPKLLHAIRDYAANPHKFIDYNLLTWTSRQDKFEVVVQCPEEVFGLEFLGNGVYGKVYAINHRLVLKVERQVDNGFRRFSEAVMARTTFNPHLPRIYAREEYHGRMFYVMERLLEYPASGDGTSRSDFIHAVQSRGSRYMRHTDPLIEEVANFILDGDFRGDLSGSNVMWRGDTPVVNDPCAY